MSRRGWVLLLSLVTACGTGSDGEGDDAWRAGRFGDAADAWAARAEAGEAELWGLAAEASRRAGRHREAAMAWRTLATALPARRIEAIEGLRRTARDAERAGDLDGLRDAAAALAALAPGVPLARHAALLVALDGPEGRAWIPAALAGATRAAEAEALLIELAEGRQQDAGCAAALETWGAALRRAADDDSRAAALAGFTACGLALGDRTLEAAPAEAEGWYRRVVEVDARGPAGRRALIGVGEARVRQGDLLGAALAWQTVIGSQEDSLATEATVRLNSLANAAGPDDIEDR